MNKLATLAITERAQIVAIICFYTKICIQQYHVEDTI